VSAPDVVSGPKPAITPAQIAAGLVAGVPIIASLLSAFGVYTVSKPEQDALKQTVEWGVIFGGLLVGGDAHLRSARNKAEAAKHAAITVAFGNRRAATPAPARTDSAPAAAPPPPSASTMTRDALAAAGPPDADADGPGDPDGVPHLVATDPAEIAADKGDAGPAGLDS
jgi:hypothetical protein